MRVLLTGSSGLVGSVCASQLASRGWEVVGLARGEGADAALTEFVKADIGTPEAAKAVTSATRACDAIVHAAAAIDWDAVSSAITLTNCLGTQQMLELAGIWGVRRFVYISSIPVIGRPLDVPINESHPANPLTAYHASKLFGEHLVEGARRHSLAGVSLRLSAPVGPHMPRDRLLPTFVRQACAGESLRIAGRGTRRQNYVDVADVAQAVELALKGGAAGVFNVAGSRSIADSELADLCIRIFDSRSSVESTGRRDPEEGVTWDVSLEKARRELGYEPARTLEDSILDLAAASVDRHPSCTAPG